LEMGDIRAKHCFRKPESMFWQELRWRFRN
jgi:hypothetical protein